MGMNAEESDQPTQDLAFLLLQSRHHYLYEELRLSMKNRLGTAENLTKEKCSEPAASLQYLYPMS